MSTKNRWTEVEVEALRAGVKKHGYGKWIHILRDPEFGPKLHNRNNISLKGKWRHMIQSEVKQGSSSSGSTEEDDGFVLDYEEAIKSALKFPEDPRGSQMITIADFIEQNYDVHEDYLQRVDQEMTKLIEENRVERDEAGFYKWLGI